MRENIKLLIGYDGSDFADAALDLRCAGLPPKVEALVMSVAEVWLPPPPQANSENPEEEMEIKPPSEIESAYAKRSAAVEGALAFAERAGKRLRSDFPGWKVSAEASSGSPAWELVLKADQWNPDLVVVGSHGRTAIGRLVLGSVSQRVVEEARCSVRVARGRRVEEPEGTVRILVGIDGSPGSKAAVEEVASRPWATKTYVKLMFAEDPLTSTFEGRNWAEEILSEWAGLVRGAEVEVSTEIRIGNPKRVLILAAEETKADCIFVGSTGFSNRLERFVLGSVSTAVVARAHCSVEVVRRSSGGVVS